MIEKLKFILIFIVILAIVVLLGYWAVVSIEPANISVERQKQAELKQQNEELVKKIADLTDQLRVLKDAQPIPETPDNTSPPTTTTTKPASSKYQGLINDLQTLVTDNIFMKEKSQGTRVGTIQTFLNIYNKTSKPVDNDYGPGTKTDVINFQKAQGITADGETGPGTYGKMIDWLKKQ